MWGQISKETPGRTEWLKKSKPVWNKGIVKSESFRWINFRSGKTSPSVRPIPLMNPTELKTSNFMSSKSSLQTRLSGCFQHWVTNSWKSLTVK
jgi:hypothetical protein